MCNACGLVYAKMVSDPIPFVFVFPGLSFLTPSAIRLRMVMQTTLLGFPVTHKPGPVFNRPTVQTNYRHFSPFWSDQEKRPRCSKSAGRSDRGYNVWRRITTRPRAIACTGNRCAHFRHTQRSGERRRAFIWFARARMRISNPL